MKYAGIFLPVYLLLPFFVLAQQGSTCSNPIPLTIGAPCADYPISASTGSSEICGYGTFHVTYFSFTPSSSQCILLNISEPNGQPCEAALYAGGSCNGGSLEPYSSMCFDDGEGIWAPALYVNGVLQSPADVVPGTPYVLRIQTKSTSGNISICGQYYTPPNDDCNGAFNLGDAPISDNNACHTAGPGVVANDLAASTLENTAFYKYSMLSTGSSTFTISNIDCDNGVSVADGPNNIGIQVGVFMGNCSSLTRIDRFTGDNSSGTINRIYTYPAGTNIYVAIDGTSGSNCKYSLSATNSEPLPAYLKYFTAWKTANSNILKWVSLQEINNDHYELQRSENGRNFLTIGIINGERNSTSEKTYSFEDLHPPKKCFYRLKQVDIDGHEKTFKTIEVIRTDLPYIELSFQNPITDNLLLNLQTSSGGQGELKIISMNGAVILSKTIKYDSGDNTFFTNLSFLPAGKYLLSVEGKNIKSVKTFIKTNKSVF